MSPAHAQSTRHASVPTPLGPLLCVALDDAGGDALSGVYFPGHRPAPAASELGPRVRLETDPLLSETARQLRDYLEGRRDGFQLPLAAPRDDVARRVRELLREIPYGTTTTYGQIAERLGNRHLAQRVGQAVGRNPLSIVVPCHRVVGADGSLTGYAGGLERKRFLLELEEPAHRAEERLF